MLPSLSIHRPDLAPRFLSGVPERSLGCARLLNSQLFGGWISTGLAFLFNSLL
jgi:hypothetical protein